MREQYPYRVHRAPLVLLASLSLGTLLAFVGLSVEVDMGTTMQQDVALLRRIHSIFPAWLEVPMQVVTALGYYSVVTVVLLVSVYLFFRSGSRLYTLLLAISTFGDTILTTALKIFNHQTRPHVFHSPGYPVLVLVPLRPRGHGSGLLGTHVPARSYGAKGLALMALGAILALLIGFSRIYLGIHYPTDVLGGYLLATSWAAAVGTFSMLWHSLSKVRSEKSG